VAVFLSLLCSVAWGAADFAGGLISRRVSTAVVVGWSAVIGFAILTVAVALGGGWHGPWGWLPWGIVAGIASASGVFCYYMALATGTMGVVAPIASLGVLVPVVVGMFLGEFPSGAAVAGIGLALVGVVCASGPEFSTSRSRTDGSLSVPSSLHHGPGHRYPPRAGNRRPVMVAAVAGVCFGLFIVFLDYGAETSTLLTVWMMRATVSAGFLVAALVRRTTGELAWGDYGWVLGIALGDLSANLLLSVATTLGSVSVTGVLSSLYPVVTVVLAGIVLRERLLRIQIFGVVATMAGVLLISGS
jgi:drug/metabolite transporter (DMT)-like permease